MEFSTRHFCPRFPVLVTISLLFALAANAQFSTAPGSPIAVGTGPGPIAVADFNGDGIADVAIVRFTSNDVAVLLGDGKGGFSPAPGSPFAKVGATDAMAIGDFNGDGNPDIALTDGTSKSVTVLVGDGKGGFSVDGNGPFAVGASPFSIAVGDFNGDGWEDMAVGNFVDNTVSVLLGDGRGGFTAAAGSPVSLGTLSPSALAVGDFNRDGKQDLAVGILSTNMPVVLQGNGSGGFSLVSTPTLVGLGRVISIAVADFNGDGIPDLATAFAGHTGEVDVWLGDGSGKFPTGTPFVVLATPYSIAATDVNGDGFQDLVFATEGPLLRVYQGNGKGGFAEIQGSPIQVGSPINVDNNPGYSAVGDFNGDGKPDVAVTNSQGNSLTVLLNSLPAIVANPAALTFYSETGQPAPTGIPVTVSSAQTGSTYTVASNQPWLSANPTSNATGSPTKVTVSANQSSLAAGTFTGIVSYSAPGFFDAKTTVTLNVANPSGALITAPASPFAVGSKPVYVAEADFNGDGKPDLAVVNQGSNNVTVLLGDGAGGFAPAPGSPFDVGISPTALAIGDFNGDGKADVAVINQAGNDVGVLLGDGSGRFTGVGSLQFVGTSPRSIVVGDFNGDGKLDFAVANSGDNNVTVLLGDGFGAFSKAPGSPFAVGASPLSIATGDFNGDGKLDLVVANSGDNSVTLLLGTGSGSFNAAGNNPFAVGAPPQSITAGDLNGDGKLDIVVMVTANTTANVTVFMGDGAGGFGPAVGPSSLAWHLENLDGVLQWGTSTAMASRILPRTVSTARHRWLCSSGMAPADFSRSGWAPLSPSPTIPALRWETLTEMASWISPLPTPQATI